MDDPEYGTTTDRLGDNAGVGMTCISGQKTRVTLK